MDIIPFDPALHRPRWDDFIVSSYRDELRHAVASLPALAFLDNPANDTDDYTLWLVAHRDEIVAQLGFVPFLGVTPSGEHLQGAYPINLMVRPEYRSVGLGAVLLERLLKQYPASSTPASTKRELRWARGSA